MADSTSLKLGQIIKHDVPERDAIHIAIIPLTSGETYLYSGARVKLAFGKLDVALNAAYDDRNAVGIVDPFLVGYVSKGDKFWCFLFPNSITGLQHHWQHPIFDKLPQTAKNEHELWLRSFAEKWNFDFNEMIENATGKDENYRCLVARGYDLHDKSELDDGDYELFWHHLEKFVNQKFDDDYRKSLIWSCTC